MFRAGFDYCLFNLVVVPFEVIDGAARSPVTGEQINSVARSILLKVIVTFPSTIWDAGNADLLSTN